MEDGRQEEKTSRRGVAVGWRIAIVALLAVAVGAALWAKTKTKGEAGERTSGASSQALARPPAPQRGTSGAETSANPAALPRLMDLGAGKCIPCKMMAPILEELKKEYEGRLEVVFIDVWENPDAGKQFAINLIPTQIFYDPSGKELFRHEGFFAKEDILAKWKELGVDLAKGR